MGNRALVHALAQLSESWRERRLPRIRNLFLTAPDIDKGVFLQLAEAMSGTSMRSTLYASSRDKALKTSKALQSYPRAGDATDIVIVEGIDSIDATRLETDFLGHSYYGDNVSVISDFYSVLRHGHPPSARFGLRGIPRNSPQYWEFRPSR
jgi:esterase/lipase superfamily enzyme